jgi:hypothetical protein
MKSTKSHAEGTEAGFNRSHNGAHSYYPLFCTVAQTGQLYDVHHRPGSLRDSNGADQVMIVSAQVEPESGSILEAVLAAARTFSGFLNQIVFK